MLSINTELNELIKFCDSAPYYKYLIKSFKEEHHLREEEYNDRRRRDSSQEIQDNLQRQHMHFLLLHTTTFAVECWFAAHKAFKENVIYVKEETIEKSVEETKSLQYDMEHEIAITHHNDAENTSSKFNHNTEDAVKVLYLAVKLMSDVISCEHPWLSELQNVLIKDSNINYLSEVMSIDWHKYGRILEQGFLTEHMRFLANLLYKNALVAEEVMSHHQLLLCILNKTKIDDANPFMVEWAEFAIRNLCEVNHLACEFIKKVTPSSKVNKT